MSRTSYHHESSIIFGCLYTEVITRLPLEEVPPLPTNSKPFIHFHPPSQYKVHLFSRICLENPVFLFRPHRRRGSNFPLNHTLFRPLNCLGRYLPKNPLQGLKTKTKVIFGFLYGGLIEFGCQTYTTSLPVPPSYSTSTDETHSERDRHHISCPDFRLSLLNHCGQCPILTSRSHSGPSDLILPPSSHLYRPS